MFDHFTKARIKLTFWYLLIILLISISFSAFIYIGATRELDRVVRVQRFRFEHPLLQDYSLFNQHMSLSAPDTQVIEETRQRVLYGLIGINVIIFIGSALAGYFLAGRTLKPIQEMVLEQNRFITDASHELNTPLTSLRTGIEVTLRDKTLGLPKAKETLISSLEEVDTLQALSDKLIRLTMYEKPNGTLQFSQVSIKKVILDAVNKVKTLAKQKNISIKTKIQDSPLLGDETSLIEVFTILLDNAIKYSPEKSQISIVAKHTDGKIIIQVVDQGIGIEKKDISLIFDRFFRVDKSRSKQVIQGYGLGLSIAKRIIDLHHGTINVESIKNNGTTFIISLDSEESS